MHSHFSASHSATVLGIALLAVSPIMLTTFTTKPASMKANSPGRLHQMTDQAALQREVDFPYYYLRDGFGSTLRLVNGSKLPIAFSITVHSLKGQSLQSSTLTIAPNDTLALDLTNLILELKGNAGEGLPGANMLESKTHAPDDFAEGSVSIQYQASPMMPLLGQITIANPDLHLSHESYMVQNNPGMSSIAPTLNTTWWGLKAGRDANIAISNTSDKQATADLFLDFQGSRHSTRAQSFGPHETKVISVTKLLGELDLSPSQIPEGGITIINRGLTPVLIAQGWILDTSTGFSTTLDFPSPQKPNTLYASGVPIGTPSVDSPYAGAGTFTPHVIIRNLSDSLQDVAVAVEYPGPKGTEETNLPPVSVPPYSTIDLPVDPASAQLPQSLSYCSFRIQYGGQPGSVVAALSSVEERSDFVVDSRVVNERVITMSGANPWHLDTDTESVLFLTSTSDKEGGVAVQICASGVKYHITDMRLKPHETRAISIRKLRDQQKPDFLKNKIPADARDGVVFWLDVGERPVVGRLVVFHPSGRTASNYDCGCECGDSPGAGPGNLNFDSYTMTGVPGYTSLVVGSSENLQAIAQYDDCNFNNYYYALADSWTSTPDSVGAVTSQSGGSIGHVTSQSPGQLNITATYSYCAWYYDPSSLTCQCQYMNYAYAYATINVAPRIDSITPAQGLVGTTLNVTIKGQGFGTAPTINAGSGITATVNSASDTQISASFAISASATGGNQTVSVTANSQTSSTVNFYIQVPLHLQRINNTCAPNGIGPIVTGTNISIVDCAGNVFATNACGGYENFAYQLMDQQSPPQRIVNGSATLTENFANITPSNNPPFTPKGTTNPDLSTNVFTDILALFTVPNTTCPPANLSQSADQGWQVTIGSGTHVYGLATVIHLTRTTNASGLPSFTSTITTP